MVANHRGYESPGGIAAGPRPTPARPNSPIQPDSPAAFDLLESLDDAMFAAIAGDERALVTARDLWLRARISLSGELIEESRDQYLRFAADVIRRVECEPSRDPARMMIAVEVVELLSSE